MATVTRPYYSVEVFTLGGGDFTIADEADIKSGKATWDALQRRTDICVATSISDEDVTLFIPFHAVDHAILTVTPTEVEKPEDPNCPDPEDDSEPDHA